MDKTSEILPEKFWLDSPQDLVGLYLFPRKEDSISTKLNSFTRILIIVVVGMMALQYKNWLVVLLTGLVVVLVLAYINRGSEDKKQGFAKIADLDTNIEALDINPYNPSDLRPVNLEPTYADSWPNDTISYDIIDNVIENQNVPMTVDRLDFDQRPYGQYITRTNLMPRDELAVQSFMGSSNRARDYINSTFAERDVRAREDSMKFIKLKMNSRFKHNCYSEVSPYTSS